MEIMIVGKKHFYDHTSVIYKLISKDKKQVYMRVDQTNFRNEHRYVVMVYIYNLYKYFIEQNNIIFDENIYISEEEHIKEKYDRAVSLFNNSFESPVLIPVVSGWLDKILIKNLFFNNIYNEKLMVSFVNGITRTQWLLKNNFTVCPIETDFDSANLLQKYFGIHDNKIYSVKDLMKDITIEV